MIVDLGQGYSVVFSVTLASVAGDLVEITAPSTGICIVTGVYVSQDNRDATSASDMVAVVWTRATVSGSGGSTVTPEKQGQLNAAASSVVETGNTTPATAVSLPWHRDAFNILNGYSWEPVGSRIPIIKPSGIHVLRIDSAPSASTTFKGVVYFREIG